MAFWLPAACMAHDVGTSSDPQTIHVRHSPMVPIGGPRLVSWMGKRARWTSSSRTHTTTVIGSPKIVTLSAHPEPYAFAAF
jgi:hypothetical protein